MKFIIEFYQCFRFIYIPIICSLFILGSSSSSYSNDEESDNLLNTYINVGLGYSFFGPVAQIGVIYRPETYTLNFRASASYSPDDGFVGSSISEIAVLYSRKTNGNSLILEYGAGLAGVFVSARPETYSGGIALNIEPVQPSSIDSDFENTTGIKLKTGSGHPAKPTWLDFQPQSNETRLTIGLPIEAQIVWNLNHRFSLAFHIFANFNTIKSNAGAFSTLQLRLPRQ